MTVQDLIDLLSAEDPTAEIVISRDPEGNAYAPVGYIGQGYFDSRASEFYTEEDFFNEDYDEEEPHGLPAVGIWPVY